MDLDLILQTAMQAAIEAGEYFKSRFQTELVVKMKSSLADVVTDVDPHCEKLIRERIAANFPDHAILGEEAVAPGKEASIEATDAVQASDALWIVDPLDGTTNFVHAIPLSVVSIAFAWKGEVTVGVIFDPYRDELFYAVRGQGAHLATGTDVTKWLQQSDDDKPGMVLRASTTGELAKAVVSTGLPVRHANKSVVMERAMHLVTRVKSLRTLGAAALHMAYVAASRMDGFWEYELNAWDVAAGVVIVREAGGFAGDLSGKPYHLTTRDIVACGSEKMAQDICGMMS